MTSVSRADSQKRGTLLPRLWIDSSMTAHAQSWHTPSPTWSSAYVSEAATLPDTPFSAEVFHVLCLYDFEAEDAHQLSFRKNEVLSIIKREETGWWAAMRSGDESVGWIPKAFVEPISESIARKLQEERELAYIREVRLGLPLGSAGTPSFPFTPEGELSGFHWAPLVDDDQTSSIKLHPEFNDKHAVHLPFSPITPVLEGIVDLHLGSELVASREMGVPEEAPIPPPKDAHLTPNRLAPIQRHSSPLSPTARPVSSEHSRSYSDPSSPAVARHLRRRPVLIDDQSSLSRLSTLFESKNVEEVDSILRSPDIPDSLDPLIVPNSDRALRQDGTNGPQPSSGYFGPHVFLSSSDVAQELLFRDDGGVSAGSLRALLDRLAIGVQDLQQQTRYENVFLTTFKTFASADEIFISLLSRFYIGEPSLANNQQLETWRREQLEPTQRQILAIFKTWYEDYEMLQEDPHIVRRLIDFLSSLAPPSQFVGIARSMLDSLRRSTFTTSPCRNPKLVCRKRRSSKGDLSRMDPTYFAQHLCVYEHNLYVRIRPQECFALLKPTSRAAAPNLVAFCQTREKLARWVKTSILSLDLFNKKADMLDFWIRVAEACKSLSNYASLSSILLGLSDPAVRNQHLLWSRIPRDRQLDTLMLLDEPSGAFYAYRHLQESVKGPCVPFIGIYLSDILRIDKQLEDTIRPLAFDSPLINMTKREYWYDVAKSMLRYQTHPYTIVDDSIVMDLVDANLTQDMDLGQDVQQSDLDLLTLEKMYLV